VRDTLGKLTFAGALAEGNLVDTRGVAARRGFAFTTARSLGCFGGMAVVF